MLYKNNKIIDRFHIRYISRDDGYGTFSMCAFKMSLFSMLLTFEYLTSKIVKPFDAWNAEVREAVNTPIDTIPNTIQNKPKIRPAIVRGALSP